jgi:molybdopterin synthase sulfur carrier subunit
MARVCFTPHLRRYFDLPAACEVEAVCVADVVRSLDERWPGIGFYITDERGRLRKHVAIWVDGTQVEDREALTDAVAATADVHILQALSGG